MEEIDIYTEAEDLRDKVAESIGLDWTVRGRDCDGTAIRRQVLSLILYDAYKESITLKRIGTLCGYRSRQRHSAILHNVKVVKMCLSINDKLLTPIYNEAKSIVSAFEFKAKKPEREKYRQIRVNFDIPTYTKLIGKASEADECISSIVNQALKKHLK